MTPRSSLPSLSLSSEVSDRMLIDAAVAGDRTAFETLVLRHGPVLHRYARRMLRDEGAVHEVVQDTFVAAWRQLSSFRGDSAVRTWLFAICSRKVIDSTRVKHAQPVADVESRAEKMLNDLLEFLDPDAAGELTDVVE